MNGIHDLGGMDGFGGIDIEEDEPVFHEPWEGWTYSLFFAGLGSGVFNLDEFRHSIERMDPEAYLAASYYERWLTGIERLLTEKGVLSPEEIDARQESLESDAVEFPGRTDPDLFDELAKGLADSYAVDRELEDPAFAVGDRVHVRNVHPEGHTRAPRYARGVAGVVEHVWGSFILPDAHAHGREEAEPVYNVRFAGKDLWGEDVPPGEYVHLDMWESYLEEPTKS